MFRRYRFFILGVLCAMLMPLSAAPVAAAEAASPTPPVPVFTGLGTLAEAQAAYAALPAPTEQQMAAGRAWLAAHPMAPASFVKLNPPTTGGRVPLVSVGWNWWGIRLHLTKDDVHNIWDLIWAAGIGAAAGLLCAASGPLVILCAIIGAVAAYIVAELIWNVIGYWVPNCGVHIDFYWSGRDQVGAC